MKRKLLFVFSNQHGSVINVALLILILIFLIGIGLSRMSTTDIKIANNIKQDTTTFYGADAGLDAAGEMIEQNIGCITGFDDTPTSTDGLPAGEEIIGGYFYVKDLAFAHNALDVAFVPSIDSNDADFYYPPGDYVADPTDPHTNIKIGGATRFSKGSAIQMAAGYEGLGKGAASGGASIVFDVYSQRIGGNNNSSVHFMQWVHLLSTVNDCNF
jgi:PilX N-terminal